jgi:hypothetical protein
MGFEMIGAERFYEVDCHAAQAPLEFDPVRQAVIFHD